MITLGIDTANQTLAVGVVEGKTVLGQIQTNIKKTTVQRLCRRLTNYSATFS